MFEPLCTFAEIHYGKSPASLLSEEGWVPVFGTGGVYAKATRSLFNGPAVIIPRKGTLSNPHYAPGPFWASDTTYAALPRPKVSASWPHYQLCQFRLELLNEATGVPSISRDWLAKIKIYQHSPVEQELVANVIASVDVQIKATEALIAKQERVRAGLTQDLFTRGVDEHGALRPPREEDSQLYHQTELGWYPRGWIIKELDSLVRIIDCKHYTPKYSVEGHPVLRPRNIKSDGLDFANVDYVSERDFKAMTDVYQPKRGDIVFSRNASFGVSCRVETDTEFAIGQDVIVMAFKNCDLGYIFHCMQSEAISQQIAGVSSGSTFGRINLGEIRRLKILMPKTPEQNLISKCLDVSSQLRTRLQDEWTSLQRLKSGLMQALLTGRVSVDALLQREPA